MSAIDKGKFSADISQKVIDEALRSVESTRAPEVEVATGTPEVPEPETASPPGTPLTDDQVIRAELEASQAMGRETMTRLKETHDRLLRATADLENYRRRAQKEKEEILQFGKEKLIKDFLPVIDNLERAIEHANTPADFESVKQGVEMTRKLFEDALLKHGVARLSALGKPFDPKFHEAIQSSERADVPPKQVVTEIVKGYLLNDRLIRPALVVISKNLVGSGESTLEGKTPSTSEQESVPRGDS